MQGNRRIKATTRRSALSVLGSLAYSGRAVVDGRGEIVKKRNAGFRALLRFVHEDYKASRDHHAKRRIAHAVYETVKKTGGRFLNAEQQETGAEQSIVKIMKSLKDMKDLKPKCRKPTLSGRRLEITQAASASRRTMPRHDSDASPQRAPTADDDCHSMTPCQPHSSFSCHSVWACTSINEMLSMITIPPFLASSENMRRTVSPTSECITATPSGAHDIETVAEHTEGGTIALEMDDLNVPHKGDNTESVKFFERNQERSPPANISNASRPHPGTDMALQQALEAFMTLNPDDLEYALYDVELSDLYPQMDEADDQRRVSDHMASLAD
jgi:hypothetical protein